MRSDPWGNGVETAPGSNPTMPAKKQEAHAIAFFNSAREYHDAANELFKSRTATLGS
jgi:hypothetical protein